MKKKILLMFTGSLLSAILLAGCNNNRDNQNPPPPTNKNVNTPTDTDLNNNGKNDLNDTDLNNNRKNNLNDTNLNNNGHYPESEDKNTPTDKDPGKDNNTPREDIIEDDIDVKDKDTKDE